APLAAECIRTGLQSADVGHESSVLVRNPVTDGQALTVRALTSDRYTRIYNADVSERLVALQARGPWQPAPASYGGSRGLYAGDRDMFAFMVDSGRRIFEKDP